MEDERDGRRKRPRAVVRSHRRKASDGGETESEDRELPSRHEEFEDLEKRGARGDCSHATSSQRARARR